LTETSTKGAGMIAQLVATIVAVALSAPPNDVSALPFARGIELLKNETPAYKWCKEKGRAWQQTGGRWRLTRTIVTMPCKADTALAVYDAKQDKVMIRNVNYDGYGNGSLIVTAARRGINSEFYVFEDGLLPVVAVRRVVRAPSGKLVYESYTPFSAPLLNGRVVEDGRDYLNTAVTVASMKLHKAKVMSRVDRSLPVSAVIPSIVPTILALIEHIDPERMQTESATDLTQEVLAILGANQERSYRFSVSPAGARNLMQFIAPTYLETRRLYPAAKLHPDFIAGMDDHENAMMAAMLLADFNLAMAPAELQRKLRADSRELGRYLAACYNGGPVRVLRMMKQYGDDWASKLLPETVMYVKKYEAVAIAWEQLRRTQMVVAVQEPVIATE